MNAKPKPVIEIFPFESVKNFLLSWGLRPICEGGLSGIQNWLSPPVFAKMIAEAEREMHSSKHGAVLADFLKTIFIQPVHLLGTSYQINAELIYWSELEAKWVEWLADKR